MITYPKDQGSIAYGVLKEKMRQGKVIKEMVENRDIVRVTRREERGPTNPG
jgi:hypothetical protein